MAIKLLRSNSTTRASSQRVLEDGQPLYEKDTNKLYVGDGTTQAKNLSCVTTDRIKTSEARPKAEVKIGETTAIKEIALVEDIPRVGEWVTVTGDTATLTEAGTYQVIAGVTDMQSIVYWDGKTQAYGTRNTLPLVTTTENPVLPSIYCAYPHIDSNGELSVQYYYISMRWDNSAYVWYKTNISKFSGFKYRKINYKE